MKAFEALRLSWDESGRIAVIAWGVLLMLAVIVVWSAGMHGGFREVQSICGVVGKAFWTNVTVLGDFRILLALMLPLSVRYPRVFLAFLVASLIAGFAVLALKMAFHLPRPVQYFGSEGITVIGVPRSGKSFPSSHAALVAAGVMVWAAHLNWTRILPLLAGACIVALARVAVGAHWPIDILVGAMVGILSALIGLAVASAYGVWLTERRRHLLAVLAGLAVSSLGFDTLGYPEATLFRWLILCIGLLSLCVLHVFPLLKPAALAGLDEQVRHADAQ